ncbi:MAG: hypothetical protein LBC88_04640 [Spirochaetaceae bacterium]|nr:hypothetical protein [Spirochaetaceae bacterium]
MPKSGIHAAFGRGAGERTGKAVRLRRKITADAGCRRQSQRRGKIAGRRAPLPVRRPCPILQRMSTPAETFFNFLSHYFVQLKEYTMRGFYLYKKIDANREVFIELALDSKIIIGYKGIQECEDALAGILNGRHFDVFFSGLVIDKERDTMYKEYFLRHDVSDGLKNAIEAIFISNSLSMLEISPAR